MGEIDTKPIDSVQTALTFFGQITEDRKNGTTGDEKELEKEKELEILMKELANVKLQLEAKDSAYKQALLKLDHHKKTANELSTLLKNSDYYKDFYIKEFEEASIRINELESSVNQMVCKITEAEKLQENYSLVTIDLTLTQAQMLDLEKELDVLRQEKVDSDTQVEVMESSLVEEKVKNRELNEEIVGWKAKFLEMEGQKSDAVWKKEVELELATKEAAELKEQLECATNKLEILHDLENQVMQKSAYISSLEMELEHSKGKYSSLEKFSSDCTFELNQLKENTELQEKKHLDQLAYINLLETELKEIRIGLGRAIEEAGKLHEHAENTKFELEKTREKENAAQVEIAVLKSELHEERSKQALTEAAESRAQSENSALFNALQEMGLEIEETKKENRELKEALKMQEAQKSESKNIINHFQDSSNASGKEQSEELKSALSKIGEFRNRAEQAISRAEAAEKGKIALEDQIKRMKKQKERRKAALAALREESVPRDFGNDNDNIRSDKNYQPLGKVLNMKF